MSGPAYSERAAVLCTLMERKVAQMVHVGWRPVAVELSREDFDDLVSHYLGPKAAAETASARWGSMIVLPVDDPKRPSAVCASHPFRDAFFRVRVPIDDDPAALPPHPNPDPTRP